MGRQRILKSQRHRGENVHQSIESMNEKAPEEAERGRPLRMSSPWKKVARKPGSERMCPAEYMGSGAGCVLAWRCPDVVATEARR
jgi:hypothetical protein